MSDLQTGHRLVPKNTPPGPVEARWAWACALNGGWFVHAGVKREGRVSTRVGIFNATRPDMIREAQQRDLMEEFDVLAY